MSYLPLYIPFPENKAYFRPKADFHKMSNIVHIMGYPIPQKYFWQLNQHWYKLEKKRNKNRVSPWSLKLKLLMTPVFPYFRTHHSKMTITKLMIETHDQNIYQNTHNTILIPHTKYDIHWAMQINQTWHTHTHIISKEMFIRVECKFQGTLISWLFTLVLDINICL